MIPLDGGGSVPLGHPLRPNAIRHSGPQPPHDVDRRRRGTQRRGGPLMQLEGPTSAGLMYSDSGSDGPVVVLSRGVDERRPVGHCGHRPGRSLSLHRPRAAVRRAHHAEANAGNVRFWLGCQAGGRKSILEDR